jgi:threonine dehydrogenase-like Zn-dependent dehydrogenase
VLWASRLGGRVIVSERAPGRRALAAALGATQVIDPERDDLGAALPPEGVDVAFEAVGAPGLIQSCVERVRFRGRVIVAGVCITPDSFHPAAAVLKEAALHFTLAYELRDFERTVRALEDGTLRPGRMVTERIGLDAVPGAFEALARPSHQGKVLVLPWSTPS